MPRSELVDIAGFVKIETRKGDANAGEYLFFDGTREVWLPKSQVQWDENTKTMTMPEWLAMEKELI